MFVVLASSYAAAARGVMDPRFFSAPVGNDVWFEGDVPTVADTVLHRWNSYPRDAHHPLFPLMTIGPSYALKAIGWTDAHRLLAIAMLAAAAWSAAVYLLLRLSTPSRGDAVVFTLLAHVTAAAVFWLPTTETYVLGSTTLLAPLVLVAWERRALVREFWYVVTSALSLSITTSNWMSGIVAAFTTRRVNRAVQITANALALVVVLWGVQKSVVPGNPFFIEAVERSRFVFPEEAGGPVAITRAFMFHSVVMPHFLVVPEPKWGWKMSVQGAALGSSGAAGAVATILWAILLAAGLSGLWTGRRRSPLVIALLLTTVGQFALHLCYGEETFLYSMHFAPLLVTCAAGATWTRHRLWVTPLAAVLVVLLAMNNFSMFATSIQFFAFLSRSLAGGR
jgi:hypothetical protein